MAKRARQDPDCGSCQETVNEFVGYLRERKDPLARTWAQRTHDIYQGRVDLDDIIPGALMTVDAFCDFIEDETNSKPVEACIEWVTTRRMSQNVPLTKVQEAFSSFRYPVFPVIVERYQGQALLCLMERVNRINDLVVFRFNEHFRRIHEQELQDYANRLEEEVKARTQELEESWKNYQILFEEIGDGCFVAKEGKIVFANKAYSHMHGYGAGEVIGKSWREFVSDARGTETGKEFFLAMDTQTINSERYVYCRRSKKGEFFPTEGKIKLITYRKDSAILGLCSDITERLEMEEKIRQKDRLALIGNIATSIAHEIRNPLSAIQINVQLLMDSLPLEGNDLRRMQIVSEQLMQTESIISGVLDFARPIMLNYGLASINNLVKQVTEVHAPKVRQGRVSLRLKLDPELPQIMADRERLTQAVTNIFMNALEAVTEKRGARRVEVETRSHRHERRTYVTLSIKDNGPGIGQKDVGNIFEPFFTKGKRGGVGLGLSIAKKIVDAHNGRITVKSGRREGSRFDIALPTDICFKAAGEARP